MQTLCCVAAGLKRHNHVFILWAQPHGELAVMLLRDDTRDMIDRILVFHWSNAAETSVPNAEMSEVGKY